MEKGFNQLDYTQPIGFGHGGTIHDIGCDLCSHASECVNAGHNTNPIQLNQDLDNNGGYAKDGNGNNDELIPLVITKIYPDMSLAFDNFYPNTPADMNLIDAQLSKGVGVIIGVSYENNPKQTEPNHFVRIYKKNSDGTYQCFDPCPQSGNDSDVDSNFNKRYAVNNMSVAQAILQAESFNYTPVTQSSANTQSSQDAVNGLKAVQLDRALILLNKANDTLFPTNDSIKYISPIADNGFANAIQNFIADYLSQRQRAGWYDKICLAYRFTGDSNQYDSTHLLNLIEETWQARVDDVQNQFDAYKKSHPDIQRGQSQPSITSQETENVQQQAVTSTPTQNQTTVTQDNASLPISQNTITKSLLQRIINIIKFW